MKFLPPSSLTTFILLCAFYQLSILLIGKIGLLTPTNIFTLLLICTLLQAYQLYRTKSWRHYLAYWKKTKLSTKILLTATTFIAANNILGSLAPEIWFDSLWYHLTLPKIYLEQQRLVYLPGELFYYSAMPQLGELLYLPSVALNNEILAKLTHAIFAILTLVPIYKIAHLYKLRTAGLIAGLIFLSDLSVAWLSSSAYIDLIRTFYETTSIYFTLKYLKHPKPSHIILAGISLGLAVSTKYFALTTCAATALLIYSYSTKQRLKHLSYYILSLAIISGYWFLAAWYYTNNPIYPIFSQNLDSSHSLQIPGFSTIFAGLFQLANTPHDWLSPISPLYFIATPLIAWLFYQKTTYRQLIIFAFSGYISWLVIPKTGGSRFIVPYLPLFALLIGIIATRLLTHQLAQKFTFIIITLSLFTNTLFRLYINSKHLPYLTLQQTKQEYLLPRLNYDNVLYDLNQQISSVVQEEKVLIIGGHSLYYADSNFVHQSFAQDSTYPWILTHNTDLPDKYLPDYNLLITQPKTNLKLYQHTPNHHE